MPPSTPSTGTITELRPLPTRPSVRSVCVDGRVVVRLSESDVADLRLAVGQPWTPELQRAVEVAAATGRARHDALGFLGRRALTRQELSAKLARREHASEIIERVIEEFVEHGWVDDAACAAMLIEQSLARRPTSRARLMAKLAARGIDTEVAARAVDRALQDVDPREAGLELARATVRAATPARGTPALARRVAGRLAREGFDEDVIEDVLRRLDLLREAD